MSAGLSALLTGAAAGGGAVLGAPWKLAALMAVLVVGGWLWLWIGGLRVENADLHAERARLRDDLAIHRALLADQNRALRALAKAEAEAVIRRREAELMRREVANAPEEEDGPLAPVLRSALDRLR